MPVHNKAFDSLEEDFKPIVDNILSQLEAKGYQPIVAEGRRTKEQQAEKVRLGYSQTMNSIHLSGLAADIVDKRYMWNISNVHEYWLDLFDAAKQANELLKGKGHLRYGMIWDHPEREQIYRKALSQKRPGLVNWFCDVAHIEMRRD